MYLDPVLDSSSLYQGSSGGSNLHQGALSSPEAARNAAAVAAAAVASSYPAMSAAGSLSSCHTNSPLFTSQVSPDRVYKSCHTPLNQ